MIIIMHNFSDDIIEAYKDYLTKKGCIDKFKFYNERYKDNYSLIYLNKYIAIDADYSDNTIMTSLSKIINTSISKDNIFINEYIKMTMVILRDSIAKKYKIAITNHNSLKFPITMMFFRQYTSVIPFGKVCCLMHSFPKKVRRNLNKLLYKNAIIRITYNEFRTHQIYFSEKNYDEVLQLIKRAAKGFKGLDFRLYIVEPDKPTKPVIIKIDDIKEG